MVGVPSHFPGVQNPPAQPELMIPMPTEPHPPRDTTRLTFTL